MINGIKLHKKIIISFFIINSVYSSDDAMYQIGMSNHLGNETWSRCAKEMISSETNIYELSYIRSGSMPLSPFAGKFEPKYLPTGPTPNEVQLANMDVLNEDVNTANQGTQMDAFGHFAYTEEIWDGKSELNQEDIKYLGGLTQKDVKPTPDSPLLHLGADSIPPIITSGILIDVKKYSNNGKSFKAGEFITEDHIKQAIKKSPKLKKRGIMSGDVVMIYTGWSDYYQDPDIDKIYYSTAPGISYGAAKYLASKKVIGVGLDTCCVDARPDPNNPTDFKQPVGTPPNQSFPVHDYFLTKVGVYTLENLNLKKLANDSVYVSCTMVLPLRSKGSAGSPIRPVAIGSSS